MSHRHQLDHPSYRGRGDEALATPKDLEKLKEKVKMLNNSMKETRLDLTNFIMETNCQAQVASNLQKEIECKAKLEALTQLIRNGKEN